MGLVDNKVALVTGAASGIGRATALLMAREGAAVAVADSNIEGAQAVTAEIEAARGKGLAVQVDVTDRSGVEAMLRAVVDRFGQLDCAVNSAGVAIGGAPFVDFPDESWDLNLAVNLNGLRYCMLAEVAQMRSEGGSIVNIASGAGLEGVMYSSGYVTSKHGVIGLTRTAALDHAREGIRINALAPGLILTPMTEAGVASGALDIERLCPMARGGEPEEVAEAALWLCSDRASFVTGVALPVDGGHLAW